MSESQKAGDKSNEEMMDQQESLEQQQESGSSSGEEEMEMCDGSLKHKQKDAPKMTSKGAITSAPTARRPTSVIPPSTLT